MKAQDFFTKEQLEEIKSAVKNAEHNTSGEIRIHIEEKCENEVLDRTAQVFEKLEMHKTKLRNGVLVYLAVADRKFAIIGDAGINSVVPANFWDHIKEVMLTNFKNNNFTEGLVKGITMAGEQLKTHFAYHHDDINELSDDISFGAI